MSANDGTDELGVVQVVMPEAVFESFQQWLKSRGMQASHSQFDPDDLPTYTVGLKDAP